MTEILERPTTGTVPEERTSLSNRLRARMIQLLAFGGLIVIWGFFAILSPDFRTYSNFVDIIFSSVVVGLLALGATFVIITSGIDLSCGTGMTLTAVMSGTFIVTAGLPIWLGVIATLVVGVLIGTINGVNVAYLRVPPFIATLAMMMVAEGLALVISKSTPIYFDAHPGYSAISTGRLIPGIPNAVLVLAVAVAVASPPDVALGAVTGRVGVEDMLDTLFGRFCIGK